MTFIETYRPYLGAGDFSDVYLEESQNLSIRWEDGKIDTLSASNDSGLGLRYVTGYETRFGHVTLPRPIHGHVSDDDIHRLMTMKNNLSGDLQFRLIAPFLTPPVKKQHPIEKHPDNYSLNNKIDLIKRAYNSASISSLIRQININYGEKIKEVAYCNSEGDSFIEERIYLVFSLTVTAERDGLMQTAYEAIGGISGFKLFDGDALPSLARMVSERAIRKLDAPDAPAKEMPVVIHSSAGGTLIHEAIGHSLEADAVLEGTSPAYHGKLGKMVANEKLTVLDDPTIPGARGSFYYDDEGIPSESTRLIENGVLKNYMFDRLSAKKAGHASNGHGRRESYAHRPIPRMSNTIVARGTDDPEKILADFKNGFLVTKMGGGQVNTANGDFVFEVEEGFLVENGRRTMVKGATLLGNGPQVLMDIDQIGSDFGWGVGTCGKEGQGVPVSDGIPTLRIKKMVIGGASK